MFCAYCGKTLFNDSDTCPCCGMPVGESHFDGSPYTSAQPQMRPGQEPINRKPRSTPRDEESAFSRTSYRANSEEDETSESVVYAEKSRTTMNAEDLLGDDEETDMDAFNPRPIEVVEQAGISENVSEIIARMENGTPRKFGRRKKADYDDYENAVEEETPVAPAGLTPSDDEDGVFDDIDDADIEELEESRFGLKQVLKIAVVLVVVAAIFIGVVSWIRYVRSNQSNSPIENVREDIYTQGVELIKKHASDETNTSILSTYTSAGSSLTTLVASLDAQAAEITSLLPEDATDNEKLFSQALTKIESNIANCITSDALALSSQDETAVAESSERWKVVENSITMLESAKTATELTAIINGEEVDVTQPEAEATPTPTPAPNYNTLSKGDKSDEVLKMQNRLWELGFLQDDRDGAFGTKTQTAVKMFQQQAGIEITGIADSATLELLYSDDAPTTAMAQATPDPNAGTTTESDADTTTAE